MAQVQVEILAKNGIDISYEEALEHYSELSSEGKVRFIPVKKLLEAEVGYASIKETIDFDGTLVIGYNRGGNLAVNVIDNSKNPIFETDQNLGFSLVYVDSIMASLKTKLMDHVDVSDELAALQEYNEIDRNLTYQDINHRAK